MGSGSSLLRMLCNVRWWIRWGVRGYEWMKKYGWRTFTYVQRRGERSFWLFAQTTCLEKSFSWFASLDLLGSDLFFTKYPINRSHLDTRFVPYVPSCTVVQKPAYSLYGTALRSTAARSKMLQYVNWLIGAGQCRCHSHTPVPVLYFVSYYSFKFHHVLSYCTLRRWSMTYYALLCGP